MTSHAAETVTELDRLKSVLKDKDSRIKELELLVDYLRRKPFKPSSEQLASMTPLFDEAEAEAPETE